MLILLWLVAVLATALALAYLNANGVVWSAAVAGAIAVLWGAHLVPDAVAFALAAVFVLVAVPLNVPMLRRRLVVQSCSRAVRSHVRIFSLILLYKLLNLKVLSSVTGRAWR